MNDRLDELRNEIDRIDDQILELIQERQKIAGRIGLEKKYSGTKVVDHNREEEILERLTTKAMETREGEAFIRELWKLIISRSQKLQKEVSGE